MRRPRQARLPDRHSTPIRCLTSGESNGRTHESLKRTLQYANTESETTAEGAERIEVVPETLDDLWHLSYVIESGDFVSGDTTRRIQRDDDQMRDTGGQREHMHITISVSDVEFARFANRLRVGGEIVDCSREDQLGTITR